MIAGPLKTTRGMVAPNLRETTADLSPLERLEAGAIVEAVEDGEARLAAAQLARDLDGLTVPDSLRQTLASAVRNRSREVAAAYRLTLAVLHQHANEE